MSNTLTIPKTPTLNSSEDYSLLRAEGLKYIEKLGSKIWTDYNTHDPGITMLELLCYAITDLGYRTAFDIPDLVAPDPSNLEEKNSDIKNFFSAAQILPVNPTTEKDLRKLMMDVPGVKNAWLSRAKDYEKPVYIDHLKGELSLEYNAKHAGILDINGLYNVLIEFEDDSAPKYIYDKIKDDVRKTLMSHRNLCEDYLSITQIQYDDIAVCTDIEVKQETDITKVQAQIYKMLIDYFSPPVNFYTLEEMLDKGLVMDEIFEGPLLRHGFMDEEELEAADLRTTLHVSDIINEIMKIDGVVSVKSIKLLRYSGEVLMEQQTWTMDLPSEYHVARLSKSKSKFIFYKGILPFMAHADDVERELQQLQQVNGKFRKRGHKSDIEIPEGEYREISDYFPVQYDFPATYGIGTAGLPSSASERRKAQAKQLKAYLLLYEQILTNYLAQLANVKKLFSFEHTVDKKHLEILGKTYYTQSLSAVMEEFPGMHNFSNEEEEVYKLTETEETFRDRRNRFLNHLLSRFSESMTEYTLTLYHMYGEREADLYSIADKEAMLHDYPKLSRDRGKAFNYRPTMPDPDLAPNDNGIWNSANIAGMKLRVARLLGMEGDVIDSYVDQHLSVAKDPVTKKWFVMLLSPTVQATPIGTAGEANRLAKIVDPANKQKPLLYATGFASRDEAETRAERIIFCGNEKNCFVNYAPVPGKSGFKLVDFANTAFMLAHSPPFTTTLHRNEALAEVKQLFIDNRLEDVIRRRNFATDLLNIYSNIVDGEELWHVEFNDPEHKTNPPLLISKEYDTEECAESTLYYILHNADNASRYYLKKDKDAVNPKIKGWRFVFTDDCDPASDVAWSPIYKTKQECIDRMNALIRYVDLFCDVENFHLIEHILLRPRTNLDTLMPACIHKNTEDEIVKQGLPKVTVFHTSAFFESRIQELSETGPFYYELVYHPGETETRLGKTSTTVFLGTEKEKDTEAIDQLANAREFGLNKNDEVTELGFYLENERKKNGFAEEEVTVKGNYWIRPVDNTSPRYTFSLHSDDGEVLGLSKETYSSLVSAAEAVDTLVDILAYQSALEVLDRHCSQDDDPYSFRISVILPAWPTRFRSQYFRKYAEKIIRQETPAHIYPKICWVGLLQMRKFEAAYKRWLQSLAANTYPPYYVSARFIEALTELRNVYPAAVLHSCDDIHGDEPQVVLDNTSLGSL